MGIAETRDEIIRLIERMQPTAARSASARSASARSATIHAIASAKAATSRNARRSADGSPPARLERANAVRRRLGLDLLESRMLALYTKLQARVDGLEARIDGLGASKPTLAATPTPAADDVASGVRSGASLGGRIREGLLADIFQLVAGSMMSGVLHVSIESGDSPSGAASDAGSVDVYFHEGELVHARAHDGIEGEEAFFRAMAAGAGAFFFHDTTDPPDARTIHNNAQFLILEGLRRADEAQSNGASAEE